MSHFQMFDCFLTHPLPEELGSHVHLAVKLTDRLHETLNSIVKLSSLALGDGEVVPDARICWQEFSGSLEVFDCSFEITALKQKKAVVVEILRIVFLSTHSSLKRLEGAVVHALGPVSNTEEVLDLARLRVE